MDALPRAPLLKSFAKQMLDGAEYLHKNGIVHRASRLISCSRSSRKGSCCIRISSATTTPWPGSLIEISSVSIFNPLFVSMATGLGISSFLRIGHDAPLKLLDLGLSTAILPGQQLKEAACASISG